MIAAIGWENRDLISGQLAALRAAQLGLADTRVAVVYGGLSAEDQLYISRSPVEQLSITALTRALARLGVPAAVLDPCQRSFLRALLDFDVVIPAVHGPYGEDGRLQGLLDYLRRPYCALRVESVTPLFTTAERLGLAGFLAGYSGLTREAYELNLRQYVS